MATLASSISADLATLQAAVTAAGDIHGAPFSTISPLLVAASQLSTDLGTALTTLDGQVVSGMDTTTDPATLATFLTNQVNVVTTEQGLRFAKAYVDRLVVNLTWSVGA